MALHPPSARRERILAMGTSGAGKTRMWLSIAKLAEQLKSPGTFYVLDTDLAVPAMLDGEHFAALLPKTQWMDYEPSSSGNGKWVPRGEVIEDPRIVVYEPYDWPEYIDSVNDLKRKMDNDDWCVVDLHNPAWDAVQDYYIDLVFRKDASDFYIEARQQNKKGGALDGDKDWSNINRMYREFANPLARLRGHLFLVTGVKSVQMDGGRADTKDIRVAFGPHGVKPAGQKMTHHMVNTIVLAQEFRPSEWVWTSVKDRERELMVSVDAVDFAKDYLVKRAGWKLA